MGLFNLFGTKTKADWDWEISGLEHQLAAQKMALAHARQYKQKESIGACQRAIEQIKGNIAKAKIARRNAPKG